MTHLRPRIAFSKGLPSSALSPDLFSPGSSPLVDLATLSLHATYIRDTLPPLLSSETPHLPPQELYLLTTILANISTRQPMTLDMIRQSRISKALKLIATSDTYADEDEKKARWPPDSIRQARRILARWERSFGNLDNLKIDLFAPEGRLHGIVAVDAKKITHKNMISHDEVIDKIWTFTIQPNEDSACSEGHMHLSVGDWWINLASLFRDSGIGHPGRGCVTWNEERAYAIVLYSPLDDTQVSKLATHEESKVRDRSVDDGSIIKVQIKKRDKGVHKLLRTMGGKQAKGRIRVFRHSGSESKFHPRGGVRYDGLYQVNGYSVHLAPPNSWTYTVTLLRETNQPTLTSILHIPTSQQFDDWEEFLALKNVDLNPQVDRAADSMDKLERLVRTTTILSGVDDQPLDRVGTDLKRIETLVKTRTVKSEIIEDLDIGELQTHRPEASARDSGYFSLPRPLTNEGIKALDRAGSYVKPKSWN